MNKLEDIEAIRNLKARYFRLIDTKQWEAWKELFAENVSCCWETGGMPDVIKNGRNEMFDFVTSTLGGDGSQSVHHGHMGEIEITGPTTATGIWPMFDYIIQPTYSIQGYGHYHEEYVKENGAWKIGKLHLTRLHTEIRGDPSGSPANVTSYGTSE